MPDWDRWLVKWRVEFWGREWNFVDIATFISLASLHFLSLLAPFYFTWTAFWLAIALYFVSGVGVTLSFHRNLSHRSFKLPRWLEYFFAYCGVLSLQVCVWDLVDHSKKGFMIFMLDLFSNKNFVCREVHLIGLVCTDPTINIQTRWMIHIAQSEDSGLVILVGNLIIVVEMEV